MTCEQATPALNGVTTDAHRLDFITEHDFRKFGLELSADGTRLKRFVSDDEWGVQWKHLTWREAIDWMISVVQLVEDPQYADEDIIDLRMRLKNV